MDGAPPRVARHPWSTALRGLLRLLWRQPLLAIPFALFFGLLGGGTRRNFLGAYVGSLIFAYSTALSIWIAEHFVQPRLPAGGTGSARHALRRTALYSGAALLGCVGAALILNFTLAPGFLGSARIVVLVATFSILFLALFLGFRYSTAYFRDSVERARAEAELGLARRIQGSFLPSSFPEMPRLEVHALNLPSRHVSGDFYDVVPSGDGAYYLAIADVAGKGVPAALLSSMLQASLRTQAYAAPSVATILRTLNSLVYRSTAVEQFATFFLARIDVKSLRLRYSNAGHNWPVLLRPQGERVFLERGSLLLGILESIEVEEAEVELSPGDVVVLYTDGVSEASSPAGEMFGDERLCELVHSLPRALSARETAEQIVANLETHLGGVPPRDDITLMVLRVRE